MAAGDQYYGKTIKGTSVLNRVVRRGLAETVTFGKEKGKCREKKHALKKHLWWLLLVPNINS